MRIRVKQAFHQSCRCSDTATHNSQCRLDLICLNEHTGCTSLRHNCLPTLAPALAPWLCSQETARRYDPAALASPSAPAPPSHTFAGPLGTASAMVDIPLVSPSPSTYHAPSAPLLPPAQPPPIPAPPHTSHTSQPPPPMPSYPAVPSAVGALTPPSAPYWPTPSPSSGPAGPGFGPAGPGGGFAGSSSGFPHSLSALDGPPSTLKGPTYHISVGQPVKVAGPPPLPGLDGHYIVFPISSTSVGPAGYPGPEGQVRAINERYSPS